MIPYFGHVALLVLLVPVFAVVGAVALGALSLLLRVRWVPAETKRQG